MIVSGKFIINDSFLPFQQCLPFPLIFWQLFSVIILCCDSIINNSGGELVLTICGKDGDALHETWAVFVEFIFEELLKWPEIESGVVFFGISAGRTEEEMTAISL